MKKKVLLLGMVLIWILTLAGCAADKEETSKEEVISQSENSSNQQSSNSQTGEVAAVVERKQLDVDFNQMYYLQLLEDNSYYIRYEKIADLDLMKIYCCRQKKEEPEEILYTYTEEEGIGYSLKCSRIDPLGNLYNLYNKDTQGETALFLEKINEQGESQYCVQIEKFEDTITQEYIMDGTVSSQGEFCALTTKGTLLFWDAQGKELQKLLIEDFQSSEDRYQEQQTGFVNAGEAGIYFYSSSEGKAIFQKIDNQQAKLEKKIEANLSSQSSDLKKKRQESITAYSMYQDFCYLADNKSLWRYSFADGNLEYLLDWSDSYVNLQKEEIEQLSEGEEGIVVLSYNNNLHTSRRLVIDWKNIGELEEKIIITLGCVDDEFAMQSLERVVARYNEQSEKYRIEFKKYENKYSYGELDKMTVDLLRGEGSDLFDFTFSNNISVDYYAAKGILEDLTPYLESSGIKLVEPVAEAMKIDGKLYTMSDSFLLNCLISPKGYSKDGGISIQQCIEMAKAYPKAYFMKNASQGIMLNLLMEGNMDAYINMQEGTCSFDSEEFIELLDTVKEWEESSENLGYMPTTADDLYQQRYLVTQTTIHSMVEYLITKNAIKDFACITGYPNEQGEARYRLVNTTLYGVNSASKNKEGAWDFLLYLLSEENQKQATQAAVFPIVQEYLEEVIQRGQGEGDSYQSLFTGKEEKGFVPTQQDQEELLELIENVYYIDRQQSVIENIISEETQSVFEGNKTAQQAASMIQNRISVFLNEQK